MMSLFHKLIIKFHINELLYRLLRPFFHQTLSEVKDAEEKLRMYSPDPNGTPFSEKERIDPAQVDLQVIVPAYNVESYIEQCVDSILSQETKYSFRVVIIDDGSTDSTGARLERYAADDRVYLIHQENRGFSGARNKGLRRLFARYVMFVDSDDFILPGTIEALMDSAMSNGADIVQGGMLSLAGDHTSIRKKYANRRNVTPLGLFDGGACGKIYAASIFEQLCFPEGYWFEDSINRFLIYPNAAYRCNTVAAMTYVYRMNMASISHTSSGRPKSADTYWLTKKLLDAHRFLKLPFEELFCKKILSQLLLNDKRTKELPTDVRKCIFWLSCELVEEYIPEGIALGEYTGYMECFRNRDWGAYNLYGKLH